MPRRLADAYEQLRCTTTAGRDAGYGAGTAALATRLSEQPILQVRAGVRYVATFKFGYDTFVPNREKNSTEELLPRLCHQYKDGVAACDRIDWAEAEMIVSATWARLEDADSARTAVRV